MIKKATSLKMFIVAIATFMALEFADSPLRSLSYLSVFAVAGGNTWLKAEEKMKEKANLWREICIAN